MALRPAILATLLVTAGCSSGDGKSTTASDSGTDSDGGTDNSTSGTRGSDGGGPGSAGTDSPGTDSTGGSSGPTGSGGSDTTGDTTDAGGSDGSSTGPGFENVGQCAFFGDGSYQNDSYIGKHSLQLIADAGSGAEICRVSFDLLTVGTPAMPCDFCYWSTVAELSNPVVVTDVDDVCANSQRALDAAAIDAMVGERMTIGFAEEATGHGDVLVSYDEGTTLWNPIAFGTWDPVAETLFYENVDGFCNY